METAPPEYQRNDDEGSPTIDLRAYLHIIRKRLWVIVAVMAIGVTAAVLYTMRQPRIYSAGASVVIDPQPPQVFGSKVQEVIQLGTGSYWSNQEYYNTQVDILMRFALARDTVSRTAIDSVATPPSVEPLYTRLVPPFEGDGLTDEQRIERAAGVFRAAMSAGQNRESRIVNVFVRHTDPALAADLANEHIRTYMAYTLGLVTEGTGDVSRFLSKELDAAETALRDSEKKLYEFREENDILSVSLEDRQSILAADIARFSAALSDARIKRIELASVRSRANKLKGEDILESPVFGLANNTGAVDTLKDQYEREKQRFLEIDETLGPKNPDHAKQKKKVNDLYMAIEREARRALHELDEQYRAALGTESQFETELERLKTEAFKLGPLNVEYSRLERQQRSDEENHSLVLGRLRTSEMSGRNEQTNINEHEWARGAGLVFPRMRLNVAVAFMLSMLLGIGLAFLLDLLDRTVKSAEDVEQYAGAPLLGVIPVVSDVPIGDTLEATRERDLFVFNNPTSRAAECCRSIRTNILFSSADRPMSRITVSSPRPREGKTTSTIYMGTTMAQSGQRVLIVDTDMRRPRLHKSLGVSRNRGITNLIMGDAKIEDCIKTTDIPNLYVLPCGPQPPNPAELLLTNKFEAVLKQLEERFDRILLDSPPLLAVTDAVVLARLSDGVVMVAQAGKTATEDLARCARTVRDVNARVLGVILNDMDVSDKRYGYYYSYYSYEEKKKPAAAEQAAT